MSSKPENCNAAKAEPRRREERVPDPIALPDTVHGVRGLTIGKRAVKYRVAGFLADLAGTVWLEGGEHVGLPDLDDSASGS